MTISMERDSVQNWPATVLTTVMLDALEVSIIYAGLAIFSRLTTIGDSDGLFTASAWP